MDYYNKVRYQWDLDGLSPEEFYTYQQTGIYSLKRGVSKSKDDKQKKQKNCRKKTLEGELENLTYPEIEFTP